MQPNIQADIETLGKIDAIPSILEVICRSTGMGFAAVARVTEDKWVCCVVRDEINFGLVPGGELQVETTICHEIRQNHQAVVIDHVAKDEAWAVHHTPLTYGFQSYISMPIILKDGSFFGTLCSIDPRPAKLNTPETTGMFKLFAELIAFHLDSVEQLAAAEEELLEQQQTAELREQFIAILGHDLLNPVGAVLNVAQLLLRMSPDERTIKLANIVQDSAYRMKALIENILDFARGRMGEGIVLNRNAGEPVEKVLGEVINELRLIWPEREIDVKFDLQQPINCDGKRIAQLFSNLLGNALSHGKKDTAVNVEISGKNDEFLLSVSNQGDKIPDAMMGRLFHPFFRGEVVPKKQGLGLGLYICSQIAEAHGGSISVTSNIGGTCFTLKMPAG